MLVLFYIEVGSEPKSISICNSIVTDRLKNTLYTQSYYKKLNIDNKLYFDHTEAQNNS